MRFLVDENLPFSLISLIREAGHDVLDVAAADIRGASDEYLWRLAARQKRLIITKDLDFPFPEVLPYPPGLVLIRVPDTFTGTQIARLFASAIRTVPYERFPNHITVIAPGRIRLRAMG